MRSTFLRATAFMCIGFAAGVLTYHLRLQSFADEINNLTSTDYSLQSIGYLSIAIAIRRQNYDQALRFTEDLIVTNVNSFTDSGRSTVSLSPLEKSTLGKLKLYREKECANKCLSELDWIQE